MAERLALPDGTPVNLWYCLTCKTAWRDQDYAEKCCICSECGEPCKGQAAGGSDYERLHAKCSRAMRERQDREEMAAAELVADPDGWVYCEELSNADSNNGFFSTLQELMETWEDLSEEEDLASRPEFAYCCDADPPPKADADDVIACLTDEMFEDAESSFSGVTELQAALDVFNEKNKGLLTYRADRKRKVRIPWEERDASPAVTLEQPH